MSPTGYGTRSLSEAELGDLWDISIRYLEKFDFGADSPHLPSFRSLLRSPPAKFLELGADQLLTGSFRGGVYPNPHFWASVDGRWVLG